LKERKKKKEGKGEKRRKVLSEQFIWYSFGFVDLPGGQRSGREKKGCSEGKKEGKKGKREKAILSSILILSASYYAGKERGGGQKGRSVPGFRRSDPEKKGRRKWEGPMPRIVVRPPIYLNPAFAYQEHSKEQKEKRGGVREILKIFRGGEKEGENYYLKGFHGPSMPISFFNS